MLFRMTGTPSDTRSPSSLVSIPNVALLALALFALVGTWGHNVTYLSLGFVGANIKFWQDTLVNPASRSITFDLFALVLAVCYWMFGEARRLSMRGIWLYIVAGLLIAISVSFPIFLIHRSYARAQRGEPITRETLSRGDKLGIIGLTAIGVAYLLWSFGVFD
jgi:hypothetical protein